MAQPIQPNLGVNGLGWLLSAAIQQDFPQTATKIFFSRPGIIPLIQIRNPLRPKHYSHFVNFAVNRAKYLRGFPSKIIPFWVSTPTQSYLVVQVSIPSKFCKSHTRSGSESVFFCLPLKLHILQEHYDKIFRLQGWAGLTSNGHMLCGGFKARTVQIDQGLQSLTVLPQVSLCFNKNYVVL